MDYPHPDLHAPIALSVTVAATRRRQVRRSARPREYLTEREIEKASDMGTSGGGHSTISTCPQRCVFAEFERAIVQERIRAGAIIPGRAS